MTIEMTSNINRYGKRIIAVCCVVLIVLLQFVFVVPASAKATAGEDFEVRVQYEGERGGKIRTVAVYSNSDLEAMGAHNQLFSNITRVGAVMHSAAYCIELKRIIEAAGIDLGSVKSFTFRTNDGYTMTYNDDYLGSSGWYYPQLSSLSDRVDTGNEEGVVQMKPGALDDSIPQSNAVLAIKSYSLEESNIVPSYDEMTADNAYRFFTGQTDLSYLKYEDKDGNEAFHPTTKDDITAWDSAKNIYGIDIVLKGSSPLDGISLDVIGDDMKVGSQVQVKVTFEGDAFGMFSSSDVSWSSSDESIATVDGNGVVTIQSEGEVTITAEAAGHTASVTINVEEGEASVEDETQTDNDQKDDQDDTEQKDNEKDNPDKVTATTEATEPTKTKQRAYKKPDHKEEQKADKDNKKKVLIAKEVSIGKEIKPEPEKAEAAVSVKSDAQALEEVEAYDKRVVTGSAAAAILACGGGAVFRLRRFQIDLGKNIRKK